MNKLVIGSFVLLLSIALSFYAGRVSTDDWPRAHPNWDTYETEQDWKGFVQFVNIWNRFVVEHDGYVPGDPYRALIESGVLECYDQFGCIRFDGPLPLRLNPHLSENPKVPLILMFRNDSLEMWCGFADGTCAKQPAGNLDWRTLLRGANYPAWSTLKERDDWAANNRNRLSWDPIKRIYVVGPAPSTTGSAASP